MALFGNELIKTNNMSTTCDCSILRSIAGLKRDCCPNIGGIKTVYLARYEDIDSVTKVDDSETTNKGYITAITFKNDTEHQGARWYEYQFRKNTGSMTSTLNVNDDTGNTYITTEINLVFGRMDTAKRIEMSSLTVTPVVAVVVDSNDIAWYVGFDDYVSASAGTGETGTNKEDRNAYTLTLTSENTDWPYELTDDALKAVETSAES